MRTPRGLPSGSKLELALACAGSTVLPVIDSAWKSGEDGTAKHDLMADIVAECKVIPFTVEEQAWISMLLDDPATLAPLKGSRDEVALAWCYDTGNARELGQRIGRNYSATPTEFVGTADYLRVEDGCVMVADLKTGLSEVTPPARNAQLRFLALAACRAYGVDRARLGILHAPEGRQPWWDRWAEVDAFELEVIATELRALAKRIAAARGADARGEVPWLRVGEHCTWCPARHACPGRVAMAKAMAVAPESYAADLKLGLDDDRLAAATLERWRAAKKVLDEVGSALYARAKERPIALGDGRVWGPVETQVEEIDAEKAWPMLEEMTGSEGVRAALTVKTSRAGIERAVKAAKAKGDLTGTIKAGVVHVMGLLRDAGAITTKTRTEYQEHTAAPLGIGPGGTGAAEDGA